MPKKNRDFFERFVVSCYTRNAQTYLSHQDIIANARTILTDAEIEDGLVPAIDGMIARGRLEIVDRENRVYQYIW
jgi:hypothetical protein